MSRMRNCADVILHVIFKAKRQHKVVDTVFVTSIFGNNYVKDEVIRKILAQESSTQCKCTMESTLTRSSVL